MGQAVINYRIRRVLVIVPISSNRLLTLRASILHGGVRR